MTLNPSTSLLHTLLSIAGWDNSKIATVTIPEVIAKFAPESEEQTVITVLTQLLFEYGYVLSTDASGNISPCRWNLASDATPVFEFNDSNIVSEVKIKDGMDSYTGVEITHYNLGYKENVLVYRDKNCEYDDAGFFNGVDIVGGYTYPSETNVIDETTGVNQIVWQEYSEDSIRYFTNKAISQGLDYNYKAFSSDFSGMIVTENYLHEYRASRSCYKC